VLELVDVLGDLVLENLEIFLAKSVTGMPLRVG
jgi:hypothetical protein